MIENAVGTFNLPLGVAQNFIVNGREVLAPMAVEEPSVVAAASFMARLARPEGGFTAESTAPEMIGQMQVLGLTDLDAAREQILAHSAELLAEAEKVDPYLQKVGGGPRSLEVRRIDDSPIGPFLVLHLIVDVRDAMGANAINTALERLAPACRPSAAGAYTCASFPIWQTAAWQAAAAPSAPPIWRSAAIPANRCGTASLPPGRLPPLTPTAPRRIIKAL